ncbi:hypothetical protein ACFXPR_00315 [Nocardia tengchongensis]|uniref:hypothetical protein n=1 Tax=Nocardia tengchongensis TaxID=2055889 RepID=UPI0036A26676
MKKFVVAALIAGGIAGPAATAAALPTDSDASWEACLASGQTIEQCHATTDSTGPGDGEGFGWTGSAYSR